MLAHVVAVVVDGIALVPGVGQRGATRGVGTVDEVGAHLQLCGIEALEAFWCLEGKMGRLDAEH